MVVWFLTVAICLVVILGPDPSVGTLTGPITLNSGDEGAVQAVLDEGNVQADSSQNARTQINDARISSEISDEISFDNSETRRSVYNGLIRVRRNTAHKHISGSTNKSVTADSKNITLTAAGQSSALSNADVITEKKPVVFNGSLYRTKFTTNRYRDVTSATICLSGVLFLLFGFILYSRMWSRKDQWLSMSLVLGEEEAKEPPRTHANFKLKDLVESKLKVLQTQFRRFQENGVIQPKSPQKRKNGSYQPLRQKSEDSQSGSDGEGNHGNDDKRELYSR